MLQCKVNFLDDTHFVWELERNAVGQDLFDKVCEHLNLLERDYFGLVMWDSPSARVWLDCAKEIRKQIKSSVIEFFFNIKFYPPDPSILNEDITRYLLCLQLRSDILIGRLPCPSDILALLGSYTVQSTLGDYDPNLHKGNYVRKIVLAPNQSQELEERVMELHSTYRFMRPTQADMLFLENIMGLPMYGVDLHPAKDASGADVMLGVSSEGLTVYEEDITTNTFLWPRVLKISHKRNTFRLKMRPSEEDETEGQVSFSLPNYRACKQLWKCSVEHHSFFRNKLQDTTAKRLLTLGSRFRYHGRTQSECLEASGNITRAPPRFTRHLIKRKENEELLEMLRQPGRTDLDDWFLVYGPEKWHISTLDDVMLESHELQEWKHHADDWCVFLDGSPFAVSGVQQVILTEEQREDQPYEVQVVQEGSETIEKVSGEQIERVVITKQWTETDGEKRVERVEMVERRVMVTKEKKLSSEDIFERLEVMQQRLEEVEAIERKMVEVEELRVGLQEVESLEQRLQEVEKEGIQLERKDDWYIFLDRRPLMLTATPTESSRKPHEELQQIVYIPKPMKKDDDWYIVFDVLQKNIEISSQISGPDVSIIIPEKYQVEEKKIEVERKIQQEPVPPEKPKTPIREEVIQITVRTEEIQKEQQEQVAVDYGRSQTVVLDQREAEPQINEEDDWFVIWDGSPRRSVPSVRSTSVDLHEETREEVIRRRVMVEEMTRLPQLDAKDDWFIFFDVFSKESAYTLTVPAVGVYEESREEVIQSRLRKEEQVTEMVTLSTKEQITVPERKRSSIVQIPQMVTLSTKEQITVPERKRSSIAQIPQFPVQSREIDDDWFLIFDKEHYELKGLPSDEYEETSEEVQKRPTQQMTVEDRRPQSVILEERTTTPQKDMRDDWFTAFDASPEELVRVPAVGVYEESREEVRKEEQVIEMVTLSTKEEITVPERKRSSIAQIPQMVTLSTKEQITVPERKRSSVVQIPQFPVQPREIDDDWFLIFDKSLPSAVGVYEESREEMIQSRLRKEEQVIEIVTLSTKEQITVPERKRSSIVQIPQFPVEPREIDDDWFLIFDKEHYELKSLPSDVRTFEVREAKDQRVQRIVEESIREKRLITEEKRVSIDERRKTADVVPQMIPVRVREVDDEWFNLLDQTPSEKRSLPSVSVATEERRMKEQEESRVRQQQMRVREEEEERRRREQEKRKQEVEVRRAQASIAVLKEAQPYIEKDDDWFILFDASRKETVVAKVPVVDRRAEEEKRRRRRQEEEERRERRKQVKVEERPKRPVTPEERPIRAVTPEERPKRPVTPEDRPVQLQTEVEDDWFILMGISQYIPSAARTPVISPVATPKPRPLILTDQPLTSTPTAFTPSITKTYQEKTKDILDITAESESETESMLMRRSWAKRNEGESIYVRHSILMLEDLDVSQEIILKHHASVTELKRVFMEVKEDFGPTEWDRRLSSYLPSAEAQLGHANGEILTRMGLMEGDGETVLLRTREIIYV